MTRPATCDPSAVCLLCELREWIANHDPEHWQLEDALGPHREDVGSGDPFEGIL